jgi:DinB superfamily
MRIEIEALAHQDRSRLVRSYADLPPELLDMPATQDQHDPDVWWTPKDHFAHQARVTEQVMLMISQAVFGSHDVSALSPDELVAIGDADTLGELRDPVDLMRVAHEATNRWRASIKDMTFEEVVAYGTRVHGELMLLLASITEQQFEEIIVPLTKKTIGELLAQHGDHGRSHWGFAIQGLSERSSQTASA